MSTFVLVHGSWHGAWCWFKLLPLLERAGHRAIAIDLPGHGTDWTAPGEVTLDHYVAAVGRALESLSEPAILVGHSRGGIVISQAGERHAEKVQSLVYLAAFLIPSGEAMLPTALGDAGSAIVRNLEVDEQRGSHRLKPEALREALYADCSDEDVALASALLTPEPNAPVGTPLVLSEARYGRLPRIYIETLRDRGVTPELQRRMQSALPCQRVISMNTSHSPFLSAPAELARLLDAL